MFTWPKGQHIIVTTAKYVSFFHFFLSFCTMTVTIEQHKPIHIGMLLSTQRFNDSSYSLQFFFVWTLNHRRTLKLSRYIIVSKMMKIVVKYLFFTVWMDMMIVSLFCSWQLYLLLYCTPWDSWMFSSSFSVVVSTED